MSSNRYIAAIDQGTASSRCLVFDQQARIVSVGQKEHHQIFPRPGWVEHDPWRSGATCSRSCRRRSPRRSWRRRPRRAGDHEPAGDDRGVGPRDGCAGPERDQLGRHPHRPPDPRAGLGEGQDQFRDRCGLPLATYFSGPKIRWLLDHVPGLRERAEAGEALFGTMDTWLIWNFTGRHVTDVTNAGRTMLMNLETLEWDDVLLDAMGVPRAMLPEIRSSAEVYGEATGPLGGVPIAGALGDQHAALFGQTCASSRRGQVHVQDRQLHAAQHRQPARHLGQRAAHHRRLQDRRRAADVRARGLDRGHRRARAVVPRQPRRDRQRAGDRDPRAQRVEDNGGCYFVPAFAGLFAPHWRSDARGVIAGLTGYITKGHLARAVLEATAWQTREIVEAMNSDAGVDLSTLKVDGGMTANNLLMQCIADVLDVPVVRPLVAETVSLGAAYAAGVAVGFWPDVESLRDNWHKAGEWFPAMDGGTRERATASGARPSSARSTGSTTTTSDQALTPRRRVRHSRRDAPGS